MSKDYIENIPGVNRRFFAVPMEVQQRMEGEGEAATKSRFKTIGGYAALFEERTRIGVDAEGNEYFEEIAKGAFDGVLEKSDVRCLYNHDPNMILGRTASNTLDLVVDEKGLHYSYVTPDRTYALDLQDAVEKKDVSQSSFAFISKDTEVSKIGENQFLVRVIKFELIYDVSPVTYPAYGGTTVSERSLTDLKEQFTSGVEQRGLDLFEAQLIVNKNRL